MKNIQIRYQVYYRLRDKCAKPTQPNRVPRASSASMQLGIPSFTSYLGNGKFQFLNQIHSFNKIDWNFSQNGKLWTYNLNYFEYLNQNQLSKEEGLQLITDFISQNHTHQDAYEPYPISLRLINWVKFLGRYQIQDNAINAQLYADAIRLSKKLEYHILANHLFENGFGLLFGAYYFQDEKLYTTAKKIIIAELNEQILPDGAHYELAPMYHHIMLHRILDAYNLVINNEWKKQELAKELKQSAEKMLGWLEAITFSTGDMPMINDSAPGIAPNIESLKGYAKDLGIKPASVKLYASGYRKWNINEIECILDVGQIAPSYQPGHSHADSLQFLLNYNGSPIVVDTGISTYEKNERRHLERSTSSHNTVTVNDENSSEVWSGFRVGRRAKVTIHEETEDLLIASHNGYRHLDATHIRTFSRASSLTIKDEVKSNASKNQYKGHIHFHSSVQLVQSENTLVINNELVFSFDQATAIELADYQLADGYNQLVNAKKVMYEFDKTVSLTISKLDPS